MVKILLQRGQLRNYLTTRPWWIRKPLVGACWVQKLKEKNKLAGQHTCTDGQELDGPFHRQSSPSRFHPPFYILACCSSFFRLILKDSPAGKFIPGRRALLLRQRRHVLLEVGLKSSFFFRHLWLYKPRCIQKDLLSCVWWDEFEVQFWQACVYLKTSAKHLQCFLSLSALLVALRLFNVLVALS